MMNATIKLPTRALFLDFDGVLHPPSAIAGAKPPLTPAEIREGWPLTFEHLPLLATLLAGQTQLAVVVSSSWRIFLNDPELGELLPPISPWYAGSVGLPYRGRAEAIGAWLRAHPTVGDFAILDDTASYFPGTWETLILCDPEQGLGNPVAQSKLEAWLSLS